MVPAVLLMVVLLAALPATAQAHVVPQVPGEGHLGTAPVFGAPWTLPPAPVELTPARRGETWPATAKKADCGPGSRPETGLQGQVPAADQASGRSRLGYRCNLELVGQYAGDGAGIMMAWYDTCAYMTTGYSPSDPEYQQRRGTYAIDASDPTRPVPTARMDTPAMINPWEALKAHQGRGLLATGEGGSFPMSGPGSPGPHFDVYDVKGDCRKPQLLASVALPDAKGHEGDWAPDGRTYYQSSLDGAPDPSVIAIDVDDPRRPRQLGAFPNPVGPGIHAVQLSADGNRGYFMSQRGPASDDAFNGLEIVDTSDIQQRRPNPQLRVLGKVGWDENILTQIGRPVRIGGHPYVITTDELGAAGNPADACRAGRPPYGFVHVVDVADERDPRVVSTIRLEVNDPAHCSRTQPDQNAALSLLYSSHYCDADDPENTTAIACSWLSSGTRVFDVRDPLAPKEIAYYNAPGRTDTVRGNSPVYDVLLGSRGKDATATAIRWRTAPGGQRELWTMSSLNGVQILRFTNARYPLPAAAGRRRCLDRDGAARGRALGPVRLGRVRRAQRRTLTGRSLRVARGLDRYCVAGGGTLRVGYPTARLTRRLPRAERRRIAGRAVLALTSSPRFAVAGIRRGTTVAALRRRLRGERRVLVAGRTWYAAGRGSVRVLLRTDGRSVLDVGIADRRLTSGSLRLRRFLTAWATL